MEGIGMFFVLPFVSLFFVAAVVVAVVGVRSRSSK